MSIFSRRKRNEDEAAALRTYSEHCHLLVFFISVISPLFRITKEKVAVIKRKKQAQSLLHYDDHILEDIGHTRVSISNNLSCVKSHQTKSNNKT